MRVARTKKKKFWSVTATVVVVVIILASATWIQYSLDNTYSRAGWRDSSPFDATRSILNVLGGVRQSLAAYLWTKTDTLFHEYFKHDLTKEVLDFPYEWLITRLDPHYTIAYYFASYTLCRLGKLKEGFDMALEGVRNNPHSAEMQENLAEIYYFFRQDPKKALYHAQKAAQLNSRYGTDNYFIAKIGPFLNLVQSTLAGKAKIPPLSTLENLRSRSRQLGEAAEGLEQH